MGGGDLNLKKSWHPGTMRNQERVWKHEQAEEEERRKIEDVKRERAEERALQELQQTYEASGMIKKKRERLDWMYEGRLAYKGVEDEVVNPSEDVAESSGTVDSKVQKPLFEVRNDRGEPSAARQRDAEMKVRLDPLFEIRRREQEAVKAVLNNPVRMAQLRALEKEKELRRGMRSESKSSHRSHPRDSHNSHVRTDEYVSRKRSRSRRYDSEDESSTHRSHPRDSHNSHVRTDEYVSRKRSRSRRYDSEDESSTHRSHPRDSHNSHVRTDEYVSRKGDGFRRNGSDDGSPRDAMSSRTAFGPHVKGKVRRERDVAGNFCRSARERAELVAQMKKDAETAEDRRWDRIKNARRKERSEESYNSELLQKNIDRLEPGEGPSFVGKLNRATYDGEIDLSERLHRGRYSVQRSSISQE